MATTRKSATRNSTRSRAAKTRTAAIEAADVDTAVVETTAVESEDAVGKLRLQREFERMAVGVSGVRSIRVSKGTRDILNEFLNGERDSYGSIRTGKTVLALAQEAHDAAIGANVRKSGYANLKLSEAARDLVARISQERDKGYGRVTRDFQEHKRETKAAAKQSAAS